MHADGKSPTEFSSSNYCGMSLGCKPNNVDKAHEWKDDDITKPTIVKDKEVIPVIDGIKWPTCSCGMDEFCDSTGGKGKGYCSACDRYPMCLGLPPLGKE